MSRAFLLVALSAGVMFALQSAMPALTAPDLKYRAVAPMLSSDPAPVAPTPAPTPSPGPAPAPTPTPGTGTPPDVSAPTSYDLINQALGKSQITAEQAAIYRVFASFNDPRLPAAYRGNDEDLPDSVDLFGNLSSYSAATQDILRPFTLRPDAPGSWFFATDAGREPLRAGSPELGEVEAAARPTGTWLSVSGTKIRVHYPDYGPIGVTASLAANASMFLNEAESVVWPSLKGLLGQEPPPDCGLACGDKGGNPLFDIYLVTINRSNITPEGTCSAAMPSYMNLNPNRQFGTLAHELMHAFQFSFPMGGSGACGEYGWLQESTAQWAVDYVYKKAFNDYEQRVAPWYLDDPSRPLEFTNDQHEYGAYLFFFYLARIGASPATIKAIWQGATNADSLAAVNGAIPGGFDKQFHEFVKYNWNPQPPWPPLNEYRTLDDLTHRARVQSSSDITLGASGDKSIPLTGSSLKHLSSVYYEFTVDPAVSTLAFLNGFTYDLALENLDGIQTYTATELPDNAPAKKHGKVQALIKRVGKDWEVADWSKEPSRMFCHDDPGERVERLVIIFSNSDSDRNSLPLITTGLVPTIFASNMGCWRWQGTASFVNFDSTQSISANVTWERAGIHSGKPGTIQGAAAGQKFGAIGVNYVPVAGSITWRAQGTDGSGCTHSGSATFNFTSVSLTQNYLVTFNMVPGGDYRRGYSGVGFTPQTTETISCPGGGAPDKETLQRLWLVAGSDEGLVHVSSDGKTMSGRVGGGPDEDTWEWNFKAQRAP